MPTTVAKAKETGIYKILTHPDVERVFRKQTGQARGLIFAGEMMAQTKLADLLSFVSQGEITFAVLGVDKRLPTGQPLADLMLSIQLREKAPRSSTNSISASTSSRPRRAVDSNIRNRNSAPRQSRA